MKTETPNENSIWAQAERFFHADSQWRIMRSAADARLLFAHRPASRAGAPRVLVSAGVHGDEPAGPAAIVAHLQGGGFSDVFEWLIFPALNPSGLERGTRENDDGIDINRDFKRRKALETRFYIECLGAFPQIDLHLSLHEDWEYDKAYLYELNSSSQQSIAHALLDVTDKCIGLLEAAVIDGHAPTARGFIQHGLEPDEPEGWPEAIFLTKEYEILSYTLETPSRGSMAERVNCFCSFLAAATHVGFMRDSEKSP